MIMKHYRVVLGKDINVYEEVRKKFRTVNKAEEFIEKKFKEDDEVYTASVYDETGYHLQQFFWNGKKMIPAKTGPHRLIIPPEDARALYVDEFGEMNFKDVEDEEEPSEEEIPSEQVN